MDREETRKTLEKKLMEKLGSLQLRISYLEAENLMLRAENQELKTKKEEETAPEE